MLDIKQFSSDLIDSYLDILTLDEKLLVFKEIKIIFTRYDFDLLFPVGYWGKTVAFSISFILGKLLCSQMEKKWAQQDLYSKIHFHGKLERENETFQTLNFVKAMGLNL
jgi:hypothetical protein